MASTTSRSTSSAGLMRHAAAGRRADLRVALVGGNPLAVAATLSLRDERHPALAAAQHAVTSPG